MDAHSLYSASSIDMIIYTQPSKAMGGLINIRFDRLFLSLILSRPTPDRDMFRDELAEELI